MARNKPYDELNKWCLELLEERIKHLGEARHVSKEIGVRDGTLSKWRSEKQRIRSDCVSRILTLYGGIPLELLSMFPRKHLITILKAHQTNPRLINLIVELLKKDDKRIMEHIENQIDLLIRK